MHQRRQQPKPFFYLLLPANPKNEQQKPSETLKKTFDMFDSETREFYFFGNIFPAAKREKENLEQPEDFGKNGGYRD